MGASPSKRSGGWPTTIGTAGVVVAEPDGIGEVTTIRTAGRRASSTVWFTQPPQRGLRGNRRTGEVTHVIVNAGDSPGERGGESRDERADGAQIRAFGPCALGGQSAHTWRTRRDPFAEVWPE